MKKILKNILKWILLVWISYSLVFTGIVGIEQESLAEAIVYRIENRDVFYFDKIEKNELEKICKYYQEMVDNFMSDENIIKAEYLSDSEKIKQLEYNELFRKYPSGYTMFIRDIAGWESMADLQIISMAMGIAIGTALYLMLDTNRKGLKIVALLYVIFVIVLGFVEGIGNVAGDDLTLLDRWIFPETYIVPITVVFVLAIVVRILRQKDIAKKLNEKLKQRKEEKIK